MNVNLSNMKDMTTRSFGRSSLLLQKHSPEILLGVGLLGMVATIVLASKATRNLDQILRERDYDLDQINDLKPEDATEEEIVKAKVVAHVQTGLKLAKLYGPSIGLGVLSVGAILGSHGIMTKRQTSLMAAYGLLAETYKAYRQRVTEQLGEDVDRNFHMGVTEETHTVTEITEDGKSKKVRKTRLIKDPTQLSIYARCYDKTSSNQYRGDRLMDRAFLMGQQNYANDLLKLKGFVFLNEVYNSLGLPWSQEGQLVGWVLKGDVNQMEEEGRDGYIDFGILNPINDADREFMNGTNDAIWLDFNVDGIVYDLI